MLKIHLNEPTLINRKYTVFLDSVVKKSFSNKRQAHDYKVKIENELNEALRRRISLYKKIIIQYRASFDEFKAQSIFNDNLKTKIA